MPLLLGFLICVWRFHKNHRSADGLELAPATLVGLTIMWFGVIGFNEPIFYGLTISAGVLIGSVWGIDQQPS